MLYNGKYLYKHESQDHFIWYCTLDYGFEASRWIMSAGILGGGGSTFVPGGLLYHWYSAADNVTVYLGNYPPHGTPGTAVVSQG